jgi:hypothetical protein
MNALCALAVALSLVLPAIGRAEADPEPTWEFEIAAPYLWLSTQHGRVRAGRVSVPVDVGFDQLFDLMGKGDLLGGAGHFELHNRDLHLTFFTDAVGAVIDSEARLKRVPDGNGEVNSSLVFVEFGAGYRVGPWTLGTAAPRKFWAEPIVGGRYTNSENDIELRRGGVPFAATGADVEFVDPFVGGRWSLDLLESLALTFRADIGGFGAGSQLAWSMVSTLIYRLPWTIFSAPLFLGAGYRVIDFDYDDDSGRVKKELDLNFRGPLLGLGTRF